MRTSLDGAGQWDAFRLVRGPTVVPDVPPLSAEQCGSVYGLGLISLRSRFGARGPMPEFREGPFRFAVHALGFEQKTPTICSTSASAFASAAPSLLAAASARRMAKRASSNRGGRNVVTFLQVAFD